MSVDPDSELICATTATSGNVGDAKAADDLLADDMPAAEPADPELADPELAEIDQPADAGPEAEAGQAAQDDERLSVYGDAAYGAGVLLDTLEGAGANIMCKVQPPVAPGGRFAKDQFQVDVQAATVTCPAGHSTPLHAIKDGQIARFGAACVGCPLAERCTTSAKGRTIRVGPHEAQLTRARDRQTDPDWKADYKATRPKVERRVAGGSLTPRRSQIPA